MGVIEQIRIKADYAAFAELAARAASFHESSGMPGHLAYAADLAIEELVTNIIKYGNSPENYIELCIAFENGRLEIVLEDSGAEFDPTAAPEPDLSLSLEERPIGKIGLSMVRNMFDEFTYARRDGKNHVELRLSAKGWPL